MVNDLSLKAKHLLAVHHDKLMHDENAVASDSGILTEIINWCADFEFEPGKWVKPNKTYRFDRKYITQINETLLDEQHASIFEDFSQDDRRSSAQKSSNEKQAKFKPTHHLILAAVTDPKILDVVDQNIYSIGQVNIELDVNKLEFGDFDCLVVVENRDSFNDWFEFKFYANLSKPLVIYRGDKHDSTACKRLLKHWLGIQGNKPAIYFGDYDLAALRIAISGGYTHLLLPEYQYLAEQAMKQHYPDKQQKYLAGLEQDCPLGCLQLLQLMRSKRAGLRQQKMYQTRLTTYSIG